MTGAFDKAHRRKLISEAAERLWRREGVRPAGPVSPPASPTPGSGDRAPPARLPGTHRAAPRRVPAPAASGRPQAGRPS
jgi:hypothetical protein